VSSVELSEASVALHRIVEQMLVVAVELYMEAVALDKTILVGVVMVAWLMAGGLVGGLAADSQRLPGAAAAAAAAVSEVGMRLTLAAVTKQLIVTDSTPISHQ